MLEKISWGDYWMTVAIVAAIYEILIILVFFRKELSQLALRSEKENANLKANHDNQQQSLFTSFGTTQNLADAAQKENNVLMPQVHDLIQSLNEFINDVAERSFIKEEVIMGLTIITREYKTLIGTPLQKSVSDFIVVECEEQCSIHLSAEEINSIWLG